MTTGSTRRTVRTSIVLKVTVVFASTMAALLIVLLAIGYIYGRRTIRTGVQNRIVGIAVSRQALLRDAIAREQERIGLVADRPRLRQLTIDLVARGGTPDERAEIGRNLAEVVAGRQGFLTASIVAPDGRILVSSDATLAGQQSGAEAAVKRGLRDRFVDKPRQVGSNYFAWVSAPIRDEQRRAIAVVIGDVNLTSLFRPVMALAGLGSTGEILLGRREGNEIAFLLPPRNAPDRKSASAKDVPALAAAIRGETTILHTEDYRHVPVLATGRPVGYDKWGLVVKIDAAEAYEILNDAWNAAAGFGVLIIAGGALAGYGVARGFSRPILRLASAAKEVTEGRLGTRVPVSSADELGELSQAFNDMTAQLAASYNRLESSNEELRRHDERVRRMVDTAELGINFSDETGFIHEVNEAWLRITGYTREEILAGDIGWAKLTAPEHVERDRVAAEQLETTGRARPYEKDYIRKDGTRVPVLVTVARIPGSPDQQVAFVMDISARKQAEQALRDSEARMQLALNAGRMGTSVVDLRTRMLSTDATSRQLLGLGPEETQLPIAHLFDRVHLDDRARVEKTIADVIEADQPLATEFRITFPEGAVRWLSGHGRSVRDARGKAVEIVGIIHDIHDRKQAEEALRASEAYFRASFYSAAVGTAQADPRSGRYLRVNPKFCEIAGYSEAELLQMSFHELTHPLDRPLDLVAHEKMVKGEIPELAREKRYLRKDGRAVWVNINASLIRDASGQPMRTLAIVQDITARKEAEAARLAAENSVRESERRFREMAESLPQLVWTCRPDGPCDYLSPQWIRYSGVAESRLLGLGWLDCIHPEDRQPLMSAWNLAVGLTAQFDVEARIRSADGNYRWFKNRAVALRDANGTVIKWFGTNTDIDEQRRAQDALRESESRRRAILESALDGLIVIDGQGRIVEFNPAAETIFGRTKTAVIGRQLDETIIPERLREAHRRGLAHFSASGKSKVLGHRIEMPALRADGTEFPVELSILQIPDSDPPLFSSFVRDITERRNAEDALRRSEEQFRTTVESVPNGIVMVDAHGQITLVNSQTERLFGYRREELLGKSVDVLVPLHARGQHAGHRSGYARRPSARAMGEGRDLFARRKDGSEFPVEIGLNPIPTSAGTLVLASVTDITERKRAEEALRESAEFNRQIISSAREAVIVFDCELRCQVWNSFMEEVSGRFAAMARGRSPEELFPTAHTAEIRAFLLRAVAGETVDSPAIQFNVPGVGKENWLAGRFGPLLDARGGIVGVIATLQDITERKLAAERIKASLHEKEVLLQEIHHRVKNNMQVVSSLLNLQSANIHDPDAAAHFLEAQNRVRSMALVHEKLYQTPDLAHIDFAAYTRNLLQYLVRANAGNASRVDLCLELEPVMIGIDAAVPCGLILNELATNVFKHAFPGDAAGELSIGLHQDADGLVHLHCRDNGVGLPEDFAVRESSSLGMRLIQMLTDQLNGQLEIRRGVGTEFRITFRQTPA